MSDSDGQRTFGIDNKTLKGFLAGFLVAQLRGRTLFGAVVGLPVGIYIHQTYNAPPVREMAVDMVQMARDQGTKDMFKRLYSKWGREGTAYSNGRLDSPNSGRGDAGQCQSNDMQATATDAPDVTTGRGGSQDDPSDSRGPNGQDSNDDSHH